jgi:hypothetical protein
MCSVSWAVSKSIVFLSWEQSASMRQEGIVTVWRHSVHEQFHPRPRDSHDRKPDDLFGFGDLETKLKEGEEFETMEELQPRVEEPVDPAN